jgi:acyl carrier protein
MPAETHVERGPVDPDEVLAVIRSHLAEILEIDDGRITRESRFADDLDADSLAVIELVEALEEELGERTVGFTIDDEDLPDLHSVGDAVDYVVARLGAARHGAAGRGAAGRGAEGAR